MLNAPADPLDGLTIHTNDEGGLRVQVHPGDGRPHEHRSATWCPKCQPPIAKPN